MLMYIDILSSRVPSSPGTPYHHLYVKSTPLTSSRQCYGPSPYRCYPRCKYVHSVFNCIYDLLLAVQKGHARRANTQYRVFSWREKEVITSKVLRSPLWLGWPLWNICVTNYHRYIPRVVSTSRSLPRSWLITGFVTRLTRRVSC